MRSGGSYIKDGDKLTLVHRTAPVAVDLPQTKPEASAPAVAADVKAPAKVKAKNQTTEE